MADQINGRLTFNNPMDLASKWMVFRLQDGSTDGTIYDSILDAKKHSDETRCFYFAFVNCLGGVTARDCAILIQFQREAREAGLMQKNPGDQPFMSFPMGDRLKGIHRQRG